MRLLLEELRWFLRGVRAVHFRTKCLRCGRTGQAHYTFFDGCWRFWPPRVVGRRKCPRCGECVLYSSDHYCMKCGHSPARKTMEP